MANQFFCFLFLLLLLTIDQHLDIIDSKPLLNHSGAEPKSHPIPTNLLHSKTKTKDQKQVCKSNKELASLCQQQQFFAVRAACREKS